MNIEFNDWIVSDDEGNGPEYGSIRVYIDDTGMIEYAIIVATGELISLSDSDKEYIYSRENAHG